MTENAGDRFVGLREAGQRVGLSYWSIRGRVHNGLLPAYRTGPNSALRVKVSDVEALLTSVKPSALGNDHEQPPRRRDPEPPSRIDPT
jgi:hypothetical protein